MSEIFQKCTGAHGGDHGQNTEVRQSGKVGVDAEQYVNTEF